MAEMEGLAQRQELSQQGRSRLRALALGACALCLGGLALPTVSVAAGEAAKIDFALPQTLEESEALKARADALHAEADRLNAIAQQQCYQKFLVNACLDDAKKAYNRLNLQARPLEQAVRDFERAQRQADADAKETKRAADALSREKEQREQAERYRADEARRAAEREQKIAAKAAQAEAGQRKTAAEEADRRQRDADRAKRKAERDAKKAGNAADGKSGGQGVQ
ncbi:hypothetical protein [Rhodocyclus tenuis]|uniref:hypothetical protein n=1 Tax=Rhodocyclus tenuis TaxID=1066 RepID=UPI001905A5A2|nr:hypothetical protein [Rhodocyclus tenuis]MBK1680428.1 hypothetical protein [Rhodocyclus tenuis]